MDPFNVRNMKPGILILTQHYPPEKSGNASRIDDLSQHLVKFGCQVTILSPHPTFPHGSFKKTWKLHKTRNIDGIHHTTIFTWQPTANNPTFANRMSYYLIFPLHAIIWALAYRKKYDVIITSAPPIFTAITGYFIKKITRKRWFFDVRDLWIDASISLGFIKKGSIFEKLSRAFEKICYTNSDMTTVTTEEVKSEIKQIYNISTDKITLLPNGVDTKIFTPANTKKNRIIYTGNIGLAQDLKKVIFAVKKVNEKIPLELYLVGDGDIRKDLEDLVKKEQLEDTILFTGVLDRDQIPKMIAESLIGIAPLKDLDALRYAIPTKVYEYMSCGIPFIGTGKGEIQNLAKSSAAGIVTKNDVTSISETIIQLLENKQLMEKMGKQGRKFAKKYYDRGKIAEHLLDSIEKVVV